MNRPPNLKSHYLLLLAFYLLTLPAKLVGEGLIWIEGESAATHSMQQHGWYNSVKIGELSNNDWLSHFRDGDMPIASFSVPIDHAGTYEFWLRANPVAAAMSVRVNAGDWQSVSFDNHEQQINLAMDAKPDLRFVAWIKAMPLELDAGDNTIEFRFESNNNRHGGLDCFVLSRTPFLPQGALKPGQKTGLADQGTWAFEPDRDSFSPAALLDLSALNEKPAGKHGRIARSADGADFVDGAGQPIRFWAVNTTVQDRDDITAVAEHAKWLAKRGVNMVRHHGHLAPHGDDIRDVNQTDIDAAWRLVAAMKQQGIYVTLSPYWAVSVKYNPAWGLKNPGGDNLTGLLFFDEELQAAYKHWLKALLTPPNPHTGIPLAEDPTLAIFQIQNEDSLLFWTEGSIKGEQRIELSKRFGAWLIQKYGSLDEATRVWGDAAEVADDDFEHGVVMTQPIYHLTQTQRGARAARLDDQLQFYTELMHAFNVEISRFLKEDIGYTGLINAGNWKTADQTKLLDAERYAYSANDVIGVNRYYNGGGHINPTEKHKAGFMISPGDEFSGESVLKRAWEFPLAIRQVQGHPMIVSESAWVPPLRYQSEGPFLVAAYSALTGVDIFYWFATSDIGFGPPMGKWQLSTPAQIGMFPAAALMFRKGFVQKAVPALVEQRTLTDVWSRRPPRLPEEAGFDPNRDREADTGKDQASAVGTLSPMLYLQGPVEVAFSKQTTPAADQVSNTTSQQFVVRSNTQELVWDQTKGVCTIDTPRAQGVTGDLVAAGVTRLSTLAIKSQNNYATVLAVSLDDEPLTSSKRVLIQIGTSARPHGWKTAPANDGKLRIMEIGGSPWNIEVTQMQLALANAVLLSATLLDANGMAVESVPVERKNNVLLLEPPANSMYLLLTGES